MGCVVFCTFDLAGATSQQYQEAYDVLATLGLKRVVKSDTGGDFVIPTTAAMGSVPGADPQAVSLDIRAKIQAAFKAKRLSAEIFILSGSRGYWAAGTT